MKRFLSVGALLIFALTGVSSDACAQALRDLLIINPGPAPNPPPTPTPGNPTIRDPGSPLATPLGIYVAGGMVCSAVSPIIGTLILQRELQAYEVMRSTLSCFLGPVGWVLGPVLFPAPAVTVTPSQPARAIKLVKRRVLRGPPGPRRLFVVPRAGDISYVKDEVVIEMAAGLSQDYLTAFGRRRHLTHLETQTVDLIGRTLQRWHIDNGQSVANTIRGLSRERQVYTAVANHLYAGQQNPPAPPAAKPATVTPETSTDAGVAQYVVGKLRLNDVHRITNGDDVRVAIIDSAVDAAHPDLAGIVVDTFDAVGGTLIPHPHGTGIAGAIAAHGKLIGVAPKVRLIAIRAFGPTATSAEGTTFNILKGLDFAATHRARIINMSFAGPSDALLTEAFARAHAKNIVLVAAVGNAGPKSPPLYPGADRYVIGVTATDADDKIFALANRGKQVAIAAPGVDIVLPAPGGSYQLTSGTSVAAAHVTGVAALLLARDPNLKPDQVRAILMRTAHKLGPKARSTDFGAGLIDAFTALESLSTKR